MLIRPNFAGVYSKANEILATSPLLTSFPFSPKELVKEQANIVCRSFKTALKHGLDMKAFGSESAVVVQRGERSIIFYDETKPETHTRFSILHELGHVVNGHDFTRKDSEAYQKYEVETNFFAAQLLMPEQLLRELQRRGVPIKSAFLQEKFGVSKQAADKRIETLAKTDFEWRSRAEKEYDDIILLRFAGFLDAIRPSHSFFDFEDEYARQRERDSWY